MLPMRISTPASRRFRKSVLAISLATAGVVGLGYASWALRPAPARCAEPAAPSAATDAPLTLEKGDHIALLGNVLADRMQFDGYLESLIYARFPKHDLVIRNLSAAGDEVATWQRSENFGTRDEWLTRVGADVIFAFYGYNESFKGPQGLEQFKTDLTNFIRQTRAQKYNGKSEPKIVLFSPAADEKHQDPNFPDPSRTNANLKLYTDAMREVAKANGVRFVDVFEPSADIFAKSAAAGKSLTVNGHYITDEGYKLLAPAMYRGIFDETAPTGDFEKLRAAINDKSWEWHTRYRTIDGYNVYGGRSLMVYTGYRTQEKFQNRKIMQEEMSQRDVMTNNRDEHVWATAQGKETAVDDSNLPPVEKVETNHPGPNPDGSWPFTPAKDAIAQMKIPAHTKVNVFASEDEFPELIAPLQMAWDARGRLWVSVWRNYPERTPTSKVGDSILIFEDTKGTGHADKVTHFIDDLNAPTGFQFYKDGILLMEAPDLWYVKDTSGGDHANYKERVLMGMDSADSHHTTNAMAYDPGGSVYLSDGVFHRTQVETPHGAERNNDGCIWRFNPHNAEFERYVAYGFANPHGKVFDYWGNDIVTDATGNASYFAPAFSGHIDYPAKHANMEQFWARPSRPCPGTGLITTRHFPQEYWGNFLNCNVIGFQGIFRVRMDEEGSGIKGTSLEDLVSSSETTFRPSQVNSGPDGAIYFTDWSNSIIGHLQHHLRDPNRDHQHGRIYRMTYEGRPLEVPPKIAGQPLPDLLNLLKRPENQIRTLAKIEIDKHPASEVVAAVKAWIPTLDKTDPACEHHMMEALWVHQWVNVVDADLLKRMLQSPEPHARAAATRVLCYWRNSIPDALALLKTSANDEFPRVRLEAVRAASFFTSAEAAEVALESLRHPTDYYLDYTLSETMKQLDQYVKAATDAGKPIALDNPAGLQYIGKSMKTEDLLKLPHTEAVLHAVLVRPDVTDTVRTSTLAELAGLKKQEPATVLLDAIHGSRGDVAGETALAKMLPILGDGLKPIRSQLLDLAQHAPSSSISEPAWAAVATADGGFDQIWKEVESNPKMETAVLSGVPYVYDQDIRFKSYEHVKPLIGSTLPPRLADLARSATSLNGRYVRIELPHKGTLTLAEVQVMSHGHNIATSGTARQSSTYKGGEASHAIDGNTNGNFSAGYSTHTKENDAHPWWEVDLGSEQPLESVVVWNRTDGNFGKRLDDYTLVVLDGKRHEVFSKKNNAAPAPSGAIQLADDTVGELRAAAIRAAVSLPKEQSATFASLVALIEKGDEVIPAARGIRTLPRKTWDPAATGPLVQALLAWAKAQSTDLRTTQEYAETVQFAGDLAGMLPADQASGVRADLKQLRVAVFVVRTVREQMRYDTPRLVVEAGKPFEIILENGDAMPHNLAIVKPGTRMKLAAQSATMRPDQLDSQGRAFMPHSSDILDATRLLEPAQREILKVTAPEKEGDYEYFCTYPGHAELMWGKLIVTKDVDSYLQAHPQAAAQPEGDMSHMHHHHG